jgi:hypothetical protein
MFGPNFYQYVVCSGCWAGDVTGCLMRRVSGRIIALFTPYGALYGVVSGSYQLKLDYCLLPVRKE